MYLHIYIHIYMYTYMCKYMHTHVYIYIYISHIQMCSNIHVFRACLLESVSALLFLLLKMYVYIYIYKCIYEYKNTVTIYM